MIVVITAVRMCPISSLRHDSPAKGQQRSALVGTNANSAAEKAC